MKNTQINRAAIQKIARALGELNQRVVYVGGAVVSLYIDDPAADDIRSSSLCTMLCNGLQVAMLITARKG